MRRLPTCLLAIVCAAPLLAQSPGFSGPVESYMFDLPTGSLRAVVGFPGAASFGPALLDGLDFGSVAPHQDFALAFRAGQCLLATHLGSDQVSTAAVDGVAGQPDSIAWSSDGSSATLYSLTGNWIQTVTGLPGSPSAGALLDLSSLSGPLTAVASDAQGKQLAVAVGGDTPGVYLATDGQSFNSVLALHGPAALAFSSDSASLFVLDIAALDLAVLNLASFDRQDIWLQGLADPFAIRPAADADGHPMVYIASRSDRLLREYDVQSQQVAAELALYFEPTGIDVFGRDSFLLASRLHPADPAWLLARQPQQAIYFVPAITDNSGGQE